MDQSENSNDCVSKNAPEARLKSQSNQRRKGERGNVFFTLFGAVAVVGVLGAGIMSTMRGPLSTMVDVNRLEQAKAEARLNSNLILAQSDDDSLEVTCESGVGDGYTEGMQPLTSGSAPTGGGLLPSMGGSQTDPWGNPYGYCSWDHGPAITPSDFSGCGNVLAGNFNPNNIAIAVISAGQDGVFQTSCLDDNGGTNDYIEPDGGGGDDIVEAMTYNQAIAGSGGLWTPDDANTEADISRSLDVTGGARFTENIDLRTGVASLILPTQAEMANSDCNAANNGLMRLNTTGTDYDDYTLEICEDGKGWLPASAAGVWEKGSGDEIYYNEGTPTVGIGLTNPNDTLDVVGTAQITGDVQLDSALDVVGATTIDSTLEVGGTSDLQGNVSSSTGDLTLDDAVVVTGTTDAQGNVSNSTGDLTLDDAVVVTGTTDAQGNVSNSTGDLTLDDAVVITGTTDAQGTVSNSTGDVTIGDDLVVTGTSDLQGTVSNSTGNVSVGDTLDVTNDLNVTGDADIDGTLEADDITWNGDDFTPYACSATEYVYWDGDSWECRTDVGTAAGAVATTLNDLADVSVGGAAATQCLVYNGTDWINQACSAAASTVWEDAGTVVRIIDAASYATDDFVFGSPQLADTGNTNHDARFFFDKSKGAFRVGIVDGTQWDDGNVGDRSFATGYNSIASGPNSIAMGYLSQATGDPSIAIGDSSQATGNYSLAMGGLGARAAGNYSTAIGRDITTSGTNSIALGLGVAAPGSHPVVSGSSSFGIFMGDQSGYDHATANRMALVGGDFLVDDDGTTGSQGCIRYNGGTSVLEYSDDCTTFYSFTDDISGLWTDLGGGRIHYGTTDANQVGVGTNNPQVTLDVGGTLRVGSVTGSAPNFMALNDLDDATITSPSDGECITYNGSAGAWENVNCAGVGGKWIDGATAGEIYYNGGNIGAGTITDPAVAMDIGGTLRIADGGETCDGTTAGALRYNTNNIQYCDGTNWRLMASQAGAINLEFSPIVQTGMDVDGTCGSLTCAGTPVGFNLTNTGTVTSAAIAYTLQGDTTNFTVIADTCTGNTLAANAVCNITVEPQANGNGTYNGRIEVSTDNAPAAILQGEGTSFGCAPGISGGGGIYVACGTYNTVVTQTDVSPSATWGGSGIKRGSLVHYANNGPQNTVNLVQYSTVQGGGIHPAAEICDNLLLNGFDNWYLPARDEITLLVNPVVNTAAGIGTSGSDDYWSSNERPNSLNDALVLVNGQFLANSNKLNSYKVRCFRRETEAMPAPEIDTTPDNFDFIDITTTMTTRQNSNTVTISGLSGPATVNISGAGTPDFSINGATPATTGTVENGDTVVLYMDSPATIGLNTATVNIGSVTDTWSIQQVSGGGTCNTTVLLDVASTYTYAVPASYDTIIIQMWGGGGGGRGGNNTGVTPGSNGGDTTISLLGLTAGGGQGGAQAGAGIQGAGGAASGGDTNINGNVGVTSIAGGNAPGPSGGNGGITISAAGTAPGGGGASSSNNGFSNYAGGGSGAYLEKTFVPATLTPGANINNIIVGAFGARGASNSTGGNGAEGRVSITCTAGSLPPSGATFTDSLDDTPADYSTAAPYSVVRVNPANDGLEFSGNEALLLPAGTVAEQPLSPAEGMIRYNTDSDIFEGYIDDGSPAWEPINTGAGGKWIDGATAGEIYYNGGNIGAGTITDPAVAMDIGGTLRIADGGEACDGTIDGAMRYTAGVGIEYCDGTSWLPLVSQTAAAILVITPGSNTAIDITVAGSPGVSSWETFTIENLGTLTSSTLNPALSNTANFEINSGSDTCTGNTLAAGATCTVQVRAKSFGDGTYSGTLFVPVNNNPIATLGGTATGACGNIGDAMDGGILAACLGTYKLIVTPGGCADDVDNPVCTGTDGLTKRFNYATYNFSTNFTDGPGNTANIVSTSQTGDAARFCDALDLGGHTDWYLPARDELALQIFPGKDDIGGFAAATYHSSSAYDSNEVWAVNMGTGALSDPSYSNVSNIRCARRTVDSGGAANLSISPGNATDIDYTNTLSNPNDINSRTFTITNNGGATSAALGTSLSNSTNFAITADTCNGNTLAPAASCTVNVRMTAVEDGSFSGTLDVSGNNGVSANISGRAVGTCGQIGGVDGGGVLAYCESGYRLIVQPVGCADDTTNPSCASPADVVFRKYMDPRGVSTGTSDQENGVANTATLVASGENVPAAQYCSDLVQGTFNDWYLPAVRELGDIRQLSDLTFAASSYWSSTENNALSATRINMGTGTWHTSYKDASYLIRCARRETGAPPASVTFDITPNSQIGMDVTGPGSPANGAPVTFTVQNTGNTTSGAIATSVSNTTNFEIVVDNCNTQTLAAGATCTIDVRARAYADGNFNGSLIVDDAANSASQTAGMFGTATGFGVTAAGLWTDIDGDRIYYEGGTPANTQVGVGTNNPVVALDVAGTIRLADGGETCDGTIPGALRYNAGVLQFCDGTSWQNVASATGGVALQFDKVIETGMDIDGATCGTPPCVGPTTTFILSNIGTLTSDALTAFNFTGTTANFEITSNTCTGVALNTGESCTINIRATANGDNVYNARMEVAHHNNPIFDVSGTAINFGCAPGISGYGGIVVQCDYDGAGRHLVINDGPNTALRWANPTVDNPVLENVRGQNDGAQNTVDILAYANGATTWFPAAQYCFDLNLNGETNWYLPSRVEWGLVLANSTVMTSANIGTTTSDDYWTSEQGLYADNQAYVVRDGSNTSADFDKVLSLRTRCMRIEGDTYPTAQTDNTPSRFKFSTKFATTPGVAKTSNTVTIGGVTPGVASVSISGDPSAQYSINGGAFTNTGGTVNWGDTIAIQIDSPSPNTSAEASLAIGSSSTSFYVITEGDCGGSCAGVDKRVFTSSGTTAARDVATLDSECQTFADTAGLGGTWNAIASSSASIPNWATNRIDYNWDRLVNMNGEVIANSPADLWDGSISNSIDYDENGVQLSSGLVRTKTFKDGSYGGPSQSGNLKSTTGSWIGGSYNTSTAHIYCLETAAPTITLTATPPSAASMNAVGPGSPATGTPVVFTIQNTGTATSAALGHSLTNSVNFQVTNDTCTGNTLAAAATCTIEITPQAFADGDYFGSLRVEDGVNIVAVTIGLSGQSTGFGVTAAGLWTDIDGDRIYYEGATPANTQVGVGTNNPVVALDVAGTIRLADGGETCDGTIPGALRYNAGVLQFCDGTSWQNVASATGGVTLQFDKIVETGMDIDGASCGAPPCFGATTSFILSNAGSLTSDTLTAFTFTGDTTSFDITSNTCTGVTLASGASCQIDIRPTASGNLAYDARMEVTHHNNPTFDVSGEASAFGCAPGLVDLVNYGGIIVDCDYGGPGNHLVIDYGGCDGTTNEPTCSGSTAGVNRQWATTPYDNLNIISLTSSGDADQNHVNIMAYANGDSALFPAAQYCEDLIHNGESDWFLPRSTELNNAYNNTSTMSTSRHSTSREGSSGNRICTVASGATTCSSSSGLKSANLQTRCMRIEGVALPTAQSDNTPETDGIRFETEFATSAGVSTTSITETIYSMTPGTAISITGTTAEYSINGGPFTAAAGTIDSGDTVQMRMDSPAIGNRAQANLTIGTETFYYSVITLPDCSGAGCTGIDKRVFLGTYSNTGSPSNSVLDASCQTDADAAGLGGVWMAISSGSSPANWAVNRIDYNWERLVNTNGDVVAIGATDLWDGTIVNPINYGADGALIGTVLTRTLSYADGIYRGSGYGRSSEIDALWAQEGSSGATASPYCIEVASGTITLTSTPSSAASMNVVGPGSPATGAEVNFTIENTGTTTTAPLGTSLSNSTNFQVTTDTCAGNTLAPAATCTVGVTPQSFADGNYFSTLNVLDATNSVSVGVGLSGVASGFGIAVANWLNGVDAGDIYYSSGNVGINTTDPDVGLDINTTDAMIIPRGTTAQQPAGVDGMMRYNSDTGRFEGYQAGSWQDVITSGGTAAGSDTQVQFNDGGTSFGGDAGFTYNPSTDTLTVGTAISVGENITIGSTTGAAAPTGITNSVVLNINDLANVSAAAPTDGQTLQYNNSTGNWEAASGGGLWTAGADDDIYYDAGADPSVGIGINTPDSILHLHEANGASAVEIRMTAGGTGPWRMGRLFGSNFQIVSPAAIQMMDNTLISTTNATPINLFEVDGGAVIGDAYATTETAPANGLLVEGNVGIGNVTPNVALDVTGDIEYSGTLTDVSDRRLKTDIAPLAINGSILERISQIDTYSFVMKDDADKRTEFGVMAQELEPIFPELVHTANDEMGTKSVNYVGLIAPMIEATKELKAENAALKAELAELKTAQAETNATLASINDQVELLSKISAANTVDKGSMQHMLILLLGLLLGAGFALVITRKNHKA